MCAWRGGELWWAPPVWDLEELVYGGLLPDKPGPPFLCVPSVKLNEHFVNTTDFLDAIKNNLDKALGKQ